METIQWGIIGCGDVTELKSGPAFNKVPHSRLVAVMRRDADKAKDYARRHNVPKWYTQADQLINDPDVTAIYIATPPLHHEEFTIAALACGKPVYVEKPMAFNAAAANRMVEALKVTEGKLSVAHYRRAQPLFLKLKEFLDENLIGEIRFVNLKFLQSSLSDIDLLNEGKKWRVDPAIAGGGLFHDLAPHQLDLMLYFFGKVKKASGISANQAGFYSADDAVTGYLIFENGILFSGVWCFTVPAEESKDVCEIIGSEGSITFSVFGNPEIAITKKGRTSKVYFDKLPHVQQPMIEKVVTYFLDLGENPCTAEEGAEVMRIMENFTPNGNIYT